MGKVIQWQVSLNEKDWTNVSKEDMLRWVSAGCKVRALGEIPIPDEDIKVLDDIVKRNKLSTVRPLPIFGGGPYPETWFPWDVSLGAPPLKVTDRIRVGFRNGSFSNETNVFQTVWRENGEFTPVLIGAYASDTALVDKLADFTGHLPRKPDDSFKGSECRYEEPATVTVEIGEPTAAKEIIEATQKSINRLGKIAQAYSVPDRDGPSDDREWIQVTLGDLRNLIPLMTES